MIHEVLLALSGHPSPLFDKSIAGENISHDGAPLLSPSEQALLQSIGRLSELHRELKSQLDAVALSHHSTVCRAAANSIRQTHLARFQKKILDVESRILTKDASIVGAYEIVPLASVVGEFDVWHRRIGWYWDLTCFMRSVRSSQRGEECSGASLIDKLRAEAQTGFPDLEESAMELSRVAETAWLRQVSSWIMHGKLPVHGADDFFIKSDGDSVDGGVARFRKDNSLLPKFVLPATASSILFVGKSIHQVRHYDQQSQIRAKLQAPGVHYSQLANAHLKHLSSLSLPIVPAHMARAVSVIRRSLSQNILQHLLPLEDIMVLLSCLRRYFLLEDGEFTLALVQEAEARIQARWQSMGKLLQQDPIKALQGLAIKEAELNQTLGQTWKTLAMRDDAEDLAFDFARKNITLSLPRKSSSRPTTSDSITAASPQVSSIAFNDTLFPSAADLILEITPPLDLFISKREVETYSAISAYLTSVRRAHLRLADLWRRTPVRREHPAPPGPRSNATDAGRAAQAPARKRASKRAVAARRVWATCSAAMSLLSETAAYLEGEIIRCSWECFEVWLKEPANAADKTDGAQTDVDPTSQPAQRDPETLAAGHRAFLAALTYALFLTDVPYTKELRSLFNNVDQLIALFIRLLDVQQRIDVDQDAGLEVAHIEEDEKKIALELDRARKRVDSDLKSVINRLRQLDHERIGAGRYLDLSRVETGGFEPWKGGGVDRLLMKLEFGRVRDDGYGYDII